jgi:proline dehydrogenase
MILRTLLRGAVEPLVQRASRAYVAGPELADAMRACRSFASQSYSATVCFWDGAEDSPLETTARYLATIDRVAEEEFDCYVSVKAPPLEFSTSLFGRIFDRARERGVGIHFDSLWPESADPTFSLIRELLPRHSAVGCTLPGRWRRSLQDADQAVELGLGVRVVKGQWADPDAPAIDLHAGFLAVIARLAGRSKRVRVATHDPVLARAALTRLRDAATPCELELLFGLPARRALAVAAALNVPVRFYVPYGHAWLPYALRQATKNPRIAWWVFRDMWSGALQGPASPAEWDAAPR